MHLCHFEDRASQFEPLSLTRPVFDLLCGMTTIAHKQRRYFGATSWSAIVRPGLADWYRSEHPNAAINGEGVFPGGAQVLVNGRWLPPDGVFVPPETSCVALAGDAIAYVYLQKEDVCATELPVLMQRAFDCGPARVAGGRMLNRPWDLVDANPDALRADTAWLHARGVGGPFTLLGPVEQVCIAPSAMIEPLVVLDVTRGPIVIDEGARVLAFSRIEGPCWIGPHTQIHGAKIRAGTSIGPHCRVGGEVEASIIHGYSNKYHEGFLGHSYVGAWVNLAAGTHNSDLRNDYGEVSVIQHGQPIATGLTKVGCFIGDHTKTGLGTLLNTGANLGAFCNLLPAGRFAPKYVPSFTSWWQGALSEAFTLPQLLATAEVAMQRRGVVLTEAAKMLYASLHAESADERRRVLFESEQRVLRKSA